MQSGIPRFELNWREERKKFYVQWREDSKLKRVSTCTDDKEEAKRFLADFISGWLTPNEEQKDNITIREIIRIYTEFKKKQHRERFSCNKTLDDVFIKKNIFNLDKSMTCALKPIEKLWGDWYPRQINRLQCREFVRIRTEEDGVSNTTAKRSFDILVAAMNHARKEGLLTVVPFVEKPKENPPRDKWARPHEVKALLSKLEELPHLQLFAMLAMHTLSRKRALLELQWAQVDLESRRIDFNPPDRQHTKKRRVPVPINNSLLKALTLAKEVATTKHVIEWRGKPCYEIGRAFRNHAREVNLGWITPHVLRHTGATLMVQNGVSMWEIAGIMGDKLETVEKHYLKHHPDYLKYATSALDRIYA